jgi:Tfp pilus assembly protein PilF
MCLNELSSSVGVSPTVHVEQVMEQRVEHAVEQKTLSRRRRDGVSHKRRTRRGARGPGKGALPRHRLWEIMNAALRRSTPHRAIVMLEQIMSPKREHQWLTMKTDTTRKQSIDDELQEASAYWDRGNEARAFRLFLSLAKRGKSIAQLNVGYFFDRGIGTARNHLKALHWYRRAYANGDSSGANNIGTILRDRGQPTQAVEWFKRAVRLGHDGSALEIAKVYVDAGKHLPQAKKYFERVLVSDRVSELDQEQARALLQELSTRAPRPSSQRMNLGKPIGTRKLAASSRSRRSR